MRCVVAAVALAAAPAPILAQDDAGAALAGVWGAERGETQLAGAVTIVRDRGAWKASAGGFTTAGVPLDGLTAFRFPGEPGELRADLARRRAYWIQPPSDAGSQAEASPVRLGALGPQMWRGTIVPLPGRIEVYLDFARGSDGALRAFIRAPNRNGGLRLTFVRVAPEGSRVRLFTATADYDGTLDAKRATLSIALPPWGTLDFTRRDALHAAGFYPRAPMPARITATNQIPAGDGWRVASLADVHLKRAPIDALLNRVLATQVQDVRAPYVQSVTIARHGKLVVDEYFYGFSADRPHDLRSAGKTLDSALVAIAAFRGARLDETTPIAPYYRSYAPFANGDPRKSRITLGNLLTMSSGFACDDNDDDSPGNEDKIQATARDWYRATLDLPMAYNPGSRALYCSQGLNLVGGVVSGATRTWLPEFFDTALAQPLQFTRYYLPIMPTGTMYLGGGQQLTPRDFLKFGQLFLDGGVWHGRRLMSEEWVRRSLRPHSALNAPGDYGLTWHIYHFTVGGKTYVAEEAGGNGGQMLFLIRDLGIVAAITAGNYGDYPTWRKFADLIPEYVIPAAL